MRRFVKLLIVVVSLASLCMAEAQAQSRRSSSRRNAARSQPVNGSGGANGQSGALPPGFGFGTHPGFSGQSGAFVPSGSSAAQTPGNPNARVGVPAGFRPPGSSFSPGFFGRIEQVHGGTYIPGYGVNNGFPTPEPVFGGIYVAGYGVNNGFARPEAVAGGFYRPGFGVMNGGILSGGNAAVGGNSVQGGYYSPGFGVQGFGSNGTAGFYSGGTSVHGGSLVPGLGVVSGQR